MAPARNHRGKGHPLGIHRVLDSKKCLPQAAQSLDNTLPIYSNEILIEVDRLNIDAASFVQMEKEFGGDTKRIGDTVVENTRTRGKQQNRVTGSGGMLTGTVVEVGADYKGPVKCKAGDRVASLVSLTLTPLHIEKILSVNKDTHQIEAKGHAVLFETSVGALLPPDIDEKVAIAVFDVVGAPAIVAALAKPGGTVVVIGAGGKAGLLSVAAARKKVGSRGKVLAIEPFPKAAKDLEILGACTWIAGVDATDPVAVQAVVERFTKGKMADLVVNVASVGDTENSALLSVKPKGKVLFFSMATSFSKVTLGAEGIACDAQLLFGNGYYPGHVRTALTLVRKDKKLREIFERRYGASSELMVK